MLNNIADHRVNEEAVSPASAFIAHPYPVGTDWGTDREVWRRTGHINAAVMSVVAWQDEATGPRAGDYQETLNPRDPYLIGTNGQHHSYESSCLHDVLLR